MLSQQSLGFSDVTVAAMVTLSQAWFYPRTPVTMSAVIFDRPNCEAASDTQSTEGRFYQTSHNEQSVPQRSHWGWRVCTVETRKRLKLQYLGAHEVKKWRPGPVPSWTSDIQGGPSIRAWVSRVQRCTLCCLFRDVSSSGSPLCGVLLPWALTCVWALSVLGVL